MGSSSADRQVRPPEPESGDALVSPPVAVDPPNEGGWLTAAAVIAWLVGLVVCVIGVAGRLWVSPQAPPEWLQAISRDAPAWVVLLAIAPGLWWLDHRRPRVKRRRGGWVGRHFGLATRPAESASQAAGQAAATAWISAVAVAAASIAVSATVAEMRVGGESLRFGDLPPAYHDEFSYLFQAQTFLAGRTWFPTHAEAPEFFDQMHVLNDGGRYASRYFPGTGAWLAPFVWMGKPGWGHWLAGGLVAFFVFWSGRELAGNGAGLVAGLLTAVAPGMALFSNLLLAHHPTLVGLSVFLYAFLRMLRTRSVAAAAVAGCGLAFAMLCRPMTAAGFGLPFGVWFVAWLLRGAATGADGRRRIRTLAAMAVPLVAGLVLLFFYNRSITGSGWTTPYAVYESIYAPRQRYGFYNVDRGAPHAGPKVRTAYDEWAENLTPERAIRNAGRRLLASWEWSLGIVPLAMAAAAAALCAAAAQRRGWFDSRWWLVPAGILSLHLAHVPYWFTGILHWHYVFETGPLWLLTFAGVSSCLVGGWFRRGGRALPVWWLGVAVLAVAANWLPRAWIDPLSDAGTGRASRVRAAVGDLAFSRLKYERFEREIERHLGADPAIVFIDPSLEDAHIEYVVNEPHLSGPVLRGRLLADEFERQDVRTAFPGRSVWWVVADEELRRRLLSGGFAGYRFELAGDLALREPRRVELWRVHPREAAPRTDQGE